jgi:hypothetical protein
MTKGAWAATAADSEILEADDYRGEYTIQVGTGGPVWLGFGEAAVLNSGVWLIEGGNITIDDHRARLSVHAICGVGATATGGYQTA